MCPAVSGSSSVRGGCSTRASHISRLRTLTRPAADASQSLIRRPDASRLPSRRPRTRRAALQRLLKSPCTQRLNSALGRTKSLQFRRSSCRSSSRPATTSGGVAGFGLKSAVGRESPVNAGHSRMSHIEQERSSSHQRRTSGLVVLRLERAIQHARVGLPFTDTRSRAGSRRRAVGGTLRRTIAAAPLRSRRPRRCRPPLSVA
jgi:hypothetical protein